MSDTVEILLVEDNPHDAELTIRGLKKQNFANKLHWVKDGVECLEFIRREGEYADRAAGDFPKLILLDLKMPKLDGLDVLRALKGDERTRSIPIVVMTSSNQERDLVDSYRLGVNGFVTKPVDFKQFMEAVAKIGMYWLIVNRVPACL